MKNEDSRVLEARLTLQDLGSVGDFELNSSKSHLILTMRPRVHGRISSG